MCRVVSGRERIAPELTAGFAVDCERVDFVILCIEIICNFNTGLNGKLARAYIDVGQRTAGSDSEEVEVAGI